MRVPLISEAELIDGQVEIDFFGRSALLLRTDGQVRAYMNV